MLISENDIEKAEERFYKKFGFEVPLFYGLVRKQYIAKWYLDGIEDAIKNNDHKLVFANYGDKNVIY